MKKTESHSPATGQEIREILGPVDYELINQVLQVGADRNEVLQAFERLDDDDYIGAQLEKPLEGRSMTSRRRGRSRAWVCVS